MNISDTNNDGIALDGFDPVSYFEGTPLRGTDEFQFSIGNMTYHFSSVENLNKFEKEPAKFIPVAGGYPTGTTVKGPEFKQTDKGFIGNKTYDYRKDLEDTTISMENNTPIDIKEDGDIEMQNLSDSSK